jgi:hypothetical protein
MPGPLDRLTLTKRTAAGLFAPIIDGTYDLSGVPALAATGQTRSDIVDKAWRVTHCADAVELRAVYDQDADGDLAQRIEVHTATWCRKYLVCPTCARRAQGVRAKVYGPKVAELYRAHPTTYFLTFTVAGRPSLAAALADLRAGFRAFVRQGQRRKGRADPRGRGEWGKVTAGLAGFEVKRGEGGAWHPHIHCLVHTTEPLDYSVYDQDQRAALERQYGKGNVPRAALDSAIRQRVPLQVAGEQSPRLVPVSPLSLQWYRATGGKSVNVDCRPIHEGNGHGPIEEQLKEVLKYPVAFDNDRNLWGTDDLVEIMADTHNGRYFERYGQYRKIPDPGLVDPETKYSQEIFTSRWSVTDAAYLPPRPAAGPMFSLVGDVLTEGRKVVLAVQAQLIGTYRTARRRIIQDSTFPRWRESAAKAASLDALKGAFRDQVRTLWRKFVDLGEVPDRPPPETWVQCALDLFPTAAAPA